MARWNLFVIGVRVTCAAVFVVAVGCGGQSERTSGDSESRGGSAGTGATGGTGGTSGTGGTNSTGGTGSGRSCDYGGITYRDGESFPVDCNTCTCSDGAVGCTAIACPPPEQACNALSDAFSMALAWAKTCQPNAEAQCRTLVPSGVQCGCPTYAQEPLGIDLVEELAFAWSSQACGQGIVCGGCPPEPTGAVCSDDGVCVDVFSE